MSSNSLDPDEAGTLVVEVPHWAATVRIFDNLYRLVATLSSSDEGRSTSGAFQIEATLAPGIYDVEVALAGKSDDEWVSIRPRKTTRIPGERWQELRLSSTAPLGDTGTEPSVQRERAGHWSRHQTWAATKPGPARLFIFVRTLEPKRFRRFSEGLLLLDAEETVVADLSEGTEKDLAAGWMAFNTDLPPGFYVLRRSRPGVLVRHQPIFLCEGWETQVFIGARKVPSLRSLTLNMATLGEGFQPDDEAAAAAQVVLDALRDGHDMRSVLKAGKLGTLLYGKFKNPWLGILAVYAITSVENDRFGPARPVSESGAPEPVTPELKNEVLQFLRANIGQHPDVRAFGLSEEPPSQPFSHPPLLRAGLALVKKHSERFRETIPLGSLTDRVLDNLVTNAPWTAWRQLAPAARAIPLGDNTSGGASAQAATLETVPPAVTVPILAASLPPSAPVFRIVDTVGPDATGAASPPAMPDASAVLHDAPLIQAVQQLLARANLDVLPHKITMNAERQVEEILSSVEAGMVSAAVGIPLARTESALGRLREGRAGKTTKRSRSAGGARAEQAIVRFALHQSADHTAGSEKLIVGDAGVAGATASSTRASAVTIEECVARLRAEADRLGPQQSTATAQPSEVSAEQARSLAGRLRRVADALLDHADFISITDTKGRLLYGNSAFTTLLSQADVKDRRQDRRAWEGAIASQPVGQSRLDSLPIDPSPRPWSLQRVVVEDDVSHEPTAYVNVLRPEAGPELTPEALNRIDSILHELTLHASFAAYGSPHRRLKSLEALEGLTAELETIVPPHA